MERTFTTSAPPSLDLRVPAGLIAVETTDGGGTEIRLDGPESLLERTTIEQHGDTIVVDAESWRGWLSSIGRELRLHVRCPEGARLSARSKSADIVAHGRFARADIASASGDVELEAVDGDASVKTASGDVSVRETGGCLSVNTASGDVGAERVGGAFRVNAVSGDVGARLCGGDVTVSSVSGDVGIQDVGTGAVQVNAVSGDVEIGVRRGSRVHVDVSSLSGDVRSDLELTGEPTAAPTDGPTVDLRVKTVSGDVSVVRAPATSAPASEPQEVQSR